MALPAPSPPRKPPVPSGALSRSGPAPPLSELPSPWVWRCQTLCPSPATRQGPLPSSSCQVRGPWLLPCPLPRPSQGLAGPESSLRQGSSPPQPQAGIRTLDRKEVVFGTLPQNPQPPPSWPLAPVMVIEGTEESGCGAPAGGLSPAPPPSEPQFPHLRSSCPQVPPEFISTLPEMIPVKPQHVPTWLLRWRLQSLRGGAVPAAPRFPFPHLQPPPPPLRAKLVGPGLTRLPALQVNDHRPYQSLLPFINL